MKKMKEFPHFALNGVAEEAAFREGVSRQTAQDGEMLHSHIHRRAMFHRLSSLHSKTLIKSFSCVFSTSPPKPSWNSYRRDFPLVCNQVEQQQSSGAIVNSSLSFCLSAESCHIPIYHHPFKCFSAQPVGPASWNIILGIQYLSAAVIKPCCQIVFPFVFQTSQFHFP